MTTLPPNANDSRRRIIVGIGPTAAGLHELRFAVDLSRASYAELHAVRAWTFPLSWHNAAADRARRKIARHAAEQCLSTAFDDAAGGSAADISVDRVLRDGLAGRVLLDYAKRATDLIVIGGRSPGLRGDGSTNGAQPRSLYGLRRYAQTFACQCGSSCPRRWIKWGVNATSKWSPWPYQRCEHR